MALQNEVLIRPTELTFSKNLNQSFDPLEVLIVSKSARILRFKVFSTTRSKYSLSKCKGVLKPGDFERITFQVIHPRWIQENRRDFFKLQFYDCANDSLLGDRYICSTIRVDPADSCYQPLDSDSCSSWPSRDLDPHVPPSPTSRAISLSRACDSSPVTSRTCARTGLTAVLTTDRASPLNCKPEKLSLARSNSIPGPFAHRKTKVNSKLSDTSSSLALPASKKSHSTSRSAHLAWIRITSLFHGLLLSSILTLCVAGISLPLWSGYARQLFHRHHVWPDGHALRSGLSCVYDAADRLYHVPPSRSGAYCPLYADEFTRQSQLAIHSIRTAFWSVYGALTAVDPLTLLPNLSWFCLGLLVMFRWTRSAV